MLFNTETSHFLEFFWTQWCTAVLIFKHRCTSAVNKRSSICFCTLFLIYLHYVNRTPRSENRMPHEYQFWHWCGTSDLKAPLKALSTTRHIHLFHAHIHTALYPLHLSVLSTLHFFFFLRQRISEESIKFIWLWPCNRPFPKLLRMQLSSLKKLWDYWTSFLFFDYLISV